MAVRVQNPTWDVTHIRSPSQGCISYIPYTTVNNGKTIPQHAACPSVSKISVLNDPHWEVPAVAARTTMHPLGLPPYNFHVVDVPFPYVVIYGTGTKLLVPPWRFEGGESSGRI